MFLYSDKNDFELPKLNNNNKIDGNNIRFVWN